MKNRIRYRSRSGVLGVLLCVGLGALAAPPVDLAGDASKTSLPRARALTPEDLVYTENVKSDETQLAKEAGKVLFQVAGRSSPGRKGRVLHIFRPEDLVKIMRPSKDGHWLAVETIHPVKNGLKVKAWLPKNAVKPPEPGIEKSSGDEAPNDQGNSAMPQATSGDAPTESLPGF